MSDGLHESPGVGLLKTVDRRKLKTKRIQDLLPISHGTLGRSALAYLHELEARGYSHHTVRGYTAHIRYFLVWCIEIGQIEPGDISKELLDRYRYELHRFRQASGRPLSLHSQHDRLAAVLRFLRWLAERGHLDDDPTVGVFLPRCSRRLPKAVLTAREAEQVLARPDVSTVLGLRDRALLELLYATGMRRQELIDLTETSPDLARGVVMVRHGKGRKDRVIPLSRRAAGWLVRYIEGARPMLAGDGSCDTLFLTTHRGPMSPEWMSVLVRRYVDAADVGKRGSCHLFRHKMATLMLEGGADLRYVQAMLGHADISTTQIYTRVAMRTLKEVHERTHPGSFTNYPRSRRKRKPPAPARTATHRTRRGRRRAKLGR